jgi:replicative DNA helicase
MSNEKNYDAEAERHIIGTIFSDNNAYYTVKEKVSANDFYVERNYEIFKIMEELNEEGKIILPDAVVYKLKGANKDSDVTVSTMVKFFEDAVIPSQLPYFIYVVSDMSKRRFAKNKALEMVKSVEDHSVNIETSLMTLESDLSKIETAEDKTKFKDCNDMAMYSLDKFIKKREGEMSGLATGFTMLDDLTDGFHGGEFIILSARPSMGKTQCAVDIMHHVAFEQKKGVAFFSLEMPADQIFFRMVCSRARIRAEGVKKGNLDYDEQFLFNDAVHKFSENKNIFINDNGYVQLFHMKSAMRKLMKQRPNISLMVVDYIQLMHDDRYRKNRQEEVSEISRGLKLLAKELNIPILALAQLNRGVEARGDGKPQLSDLRESGSLEQDCDISIMLNREEHRLQDKCPEEEKGKADVIVNKNRNGRCGTFKLGFDSKYTKFSNIICS